MPIYAYRCSACGHAKDVLQKMSDPLLVTCPACGEPTFTKQVTAAGFQLKGSGWYVTDFRGGDAGAKGEGDKSGTGAKVPAEGAAPKADAAKVDAAKAGKAETTTVPAASPAPAPASAAPKAPSGSSSGSA